MRGIALEGGGSKGSFHVGVLKALRELEIHYEVVAGTSIGAINGAILVSEGLDTLEDIWKRIEMEDMINGDTELIRNIMHFEFKNDAQKLKQFIADTFRQRGLDISPFKLWLKDVVNEDKVRHSTTTFGLVTFSLSDFKPVEVYIEDIPPGLLHEYIVASANLPAFKDDNGLNKKMLDGGFYDNLPINMLFERGCDEVIAIRVMGIGRVRKVSKDKIDKVTYILPSEDLGKLLDVGPERSKYNMTLGYYDAMRVFKKLYGKRYYLSTTADETRVLEVLNHIPEGELESIKTLIGSEYPARRMVFEEIIPLVCDVLKIDKTFGYGEITSRFYEFLAEEAGINRYEIMTFNTLFNRVNEHYLSQVKDVEVRDNVIIKKLISTLPTKSVLLLPQKSKNQILMYIYHVLLTAMSRTGFSI